MPSLPADSVFLSQSESYLVADYRIVCYTSEWIVYALLAALAFMIYPVGIPCWMFYLLYSNQETLHDEEHAEYAVIHGKLGFLYETYKEVPRFTTPNPNPNPNPNWRNSGILS